MTELGQDADSSQVLAAKKKDRSLWLQWVSHLCIVAGFLWIGWLLWDNGEAVISQFSRKSFIWFGIALVIGTISHLQTGGIFHEVINAHTKKQYSLLYTTQLFFISHMMRHMPGRFWGVVYQVNETRSEISPMALVKTNIDFMLIIMGYCLLLSASIVIFFQFHPLIAPLFFALGLIMLALVLRFNWLRWVIKGIQKFLPKRVSERLMPYFKGHAVSYSWKKIGRIMVWLTLYWFIYLMAWESFKNIYPALVHVNMVMVAAAYMAAWGIGVLSMVTPAGLGIRETAFVFFSTSLATASDTAFLAVFVRIWLLIIDLILFFIFWGIRFILQNRKSTDRQPEV